MDLINTGRASSGDLLCKVADLQEMADRYAFAGVRGTTSDLARAREYRARLDSIVTRMRGGGREVGD